MFHCQSHKDKTSPVADFCPECGDAMVDESGSNGLAPSAPAPAPVAAPAAPAARSAPTIDKECCHCHKPVAADDEFCMFCGKNPFDASDNGGAAPEPAPVKVAAAPATVVAAPAAPAAPAEPTYPATLRAVARFDESPRERVADSDMPHDRSDRVVDLDRDVIKIGRTDKKAGILPAISLDGDPGVSRRHAELLRGPDGSYHLKDADSANGTRVNDDPKPIDPAEPVAVKVGDRIKVGFWFTVTIEAAS